MAKKGNSVKQQLWENNKSILLRTIISHDKLEYPEVFVASLLVILPRTKV